MDDSKQKHLQRLAASRMHELIDVRSPWNRSLWQLGTIQSIREVLECAQATWSGAIPKPAALEYVSSRCCSAVRSDVGVGPETVRDLLAEKIEQLAAKKSSPQHVKAILSTDIEELISRANRDYLQRWHNHVSTVGLSDKDVERTARLILTHLLDDGFDRTHIHGFLTAQIKGSSEKILEDIIQKGHDMCRKPEQEYSFAIPVRHGNKERNIPSLESKLIDLETIREETSLLENDSFDYKIFNRLISQDSAAVIGLSEIARDPHTAANKVYERLSKIEERASVGRGHNGVLTFSPVFLDRTSKKLRNRRSGSQSVIVPSLDRHSLYTEELNTQLDNALGMLSSREHLSSVASVAMLWASAEGLLGHPGAQGIDVADGMAAIVACSFPRAELEDLLRKEMTDDFLSTDFSTKLESESGSGRARLLLEALQKYGSSIFVKDQDIAAASRILQIQSEPHETLTRIQNYFKDVFRRLYYQRNFIMHAAKFDSVSLPSTMRSAPKLVAAGVDRVVHAQHVKAPVTPLSLASRARNELDLLKGDGAREIYRLLK